jgi:hypothetical protein
MIRWRRRGAVILNEEDNDHLKQEGIQKLTFEGLFK